SSPAEDLARLVLSGDTGALARSLSLIIDESGEADVLIRSFFPKSGSAQKIGICGPPGAGKSTLTGRLVALYRKAGLKVGVLAVDPSSPISGGAFLGDRLRIQDHATDSGVFIRSLATRGMVGGVSHTIFGAIHALEAWGCDRIVVETVGTGQDEVVIARVADTVVYVTTPTMGDEIQAMKAGVMEVADLFVVNKADLSGAHKAISDLKTALGLGREAGCGGWQTPVLGISALSGQGLPELLAGLDEHARHLRDSGEGRERLKRQYREEVSLYVSRRVYQDALSQMDSHLDELVDHKSDPPSVAARMLRGGAN
ncbi:MAG: methylmalonyl Co-A mutase-associated GTPase MeaB, partial [Elusimicrobia bacterium]|nr:methylmalonyl Co-A mutase-associated GTPase MeaB [Elusimicrobiota bacterium]